MPAYIDVPKLPAKMSMATFIDLLRSKTPQLLFFDTSKYPAETRIPFQNYGGGHVSTCTIKRLRELGREHNFSVYVNHRQPEQVTAA